MGGASGGKPSGKYAERMLVGAWPETDPADLYAQQQNWREMRDKARDQFRELKDTATKLRQVLDSDGFDELHRDRELVTRNYDFLAETRDDASQIWERAGEEVEVMRKSMASTVHIVENEIAAIECDPLLDSSDKQALIDSLVETTNTQLIGQNVAAATALASQVAAHTTRMGSLPWHVSKADATPHSGHETQMLSVNSRKQSPAPDGPGSGGKGPGGQTAPKQTPATEPGSDKDGQTAPKQTPTTEPGSNKDGQTAPKQNPTTEPGKTPGGIVAPASGPESSPVGLPTGSGLGSQLGGGGLGSQLGGGGLGSQLGGGAMSPGGLASASSLKGPVSAANPLGNVASSSPVSSVNPLSSAASGLGAGGSRAALPMPVQSAPPMAVPAAPPTTPAVPAGSSVQPAAMSSVAPPLAQAGAGAPVAGPLGAAPPLAGPNPPAGGAVSPVAPAAPAVAPPGPGGPAGGPLHAPLPPVGTPLVRGGLLERAEDPDIVRARQLIWELMWAGRRYPSLDWAIGLHRATGDSGPTKFFIASSEGEGYIPQHVHLPVDPVLIPLFQDAEFARPGWRQQWQGWVDPARIVHEHHRLRQEAFGRSVLSAIVSSREISGLSHMLPAGVVLEVADPGKNPFVDPLKAAEVPEIAAGRGHRLAIASPDLFALVQKVPEGQRWSAGVDLAADAAVATDERHVRQGLVARDMPALPSVDPAAAVLHSVIDGLRVPHGAVDQGGWAQLQTAYWTQVMGAQGRRHTPQDLTDDTGYIDAYRRARAYEAAWILNAPAGPLTVDWLADVAYAHVCATDDSHRAGELLLVRA